MTDKNLFLIDLGLLLLNILCWGLTIRFVSNNLPFFFNVPYIFTILVLFWFMIKNYLKWKLEERLKEFEKK